MKKKTKRKLKRAIILLILGIVFGLGLMVYNILGPMRSFFWNLPYLAGFLGPKSYLVLVQNNNELRPSISATSAPMRKYRRAPVLCGVTPTWTPSGLSAGGRPLILTLWKAIIPPL